MTNNQPEKQNSLFSRVLEWAALAVVMYYCVYRFFATTMFQFTWSETSATVRFSLIVGFGLLRLLTGLWQDLRRSADRREKRAVLLKGLLALASIVPCVLITSGVGYVFFVYLPFAAFCLYGTKPERVMKAFAATIGTMLAVTILCALSGAVRNLVYLSQGNQGDVRGSYGISYPTNLASYFVYLALFVWCARRRRGRASTLLFFCLALLLAYGSYLYPKSRTGVTCFLLMAVLVLYERLNETVLLRYKGTVWISKAADGLMIGAYPIFTLLTAGLTWLYSRNGTLGYRLNALFSDRLRMMLLSFRKYGIQAFGAVTPQSGWGGGLIKASEYEFLDSSYALLPIRYGWVIALVVAVIWVWMTWKAVRSGRRRLALAMTVIAFHSFSEHHLIDPHYNILMLMPLCLTDNRRDPGGEPDTEPKPEGRKRTLAGWIAGTAVIAVFLLLLPGILSRARTLFALKGWTGGENSLYALLSWLACIGGTAAAWFALRRLLAELLERKRVCVRALAVLAALVCVTAAGARWADRRIAYSLPRYKAQAAADKAAVELLTASAEQPVYAGQLEEIYKRNFSGISGRIFTPEEMCRNARGSILLEHGNEGYQLIHSGALYTELSPYTGLFTYDDAVVRKMREAGYRFHGYYSAEREEDLSSFLELNDLSLTEDGSLLLREGLSHSLVHGAYLQQFKGNYTVTFQLRLEDPGLRQKDPQREVCLLQAAALFGEDKRARQTVRAKDFDKDGCLTASLNYSVGNTYGVEHQVFCQSEAGILVDRIAWRQNEPVDTQRKYTKNGLVRTEQFYNSEGEPLRQEKGYYGIAYEYDGSGNKTLLTYLDEDGEITETSGGYARIAREYNGRNQVVREYTLDRNGSPCLRKPDGYASEEWIYDAAGRLIECWYYGLDGNPVMTGNGYAGIRFRRDSMDRVTRESYLGVQKEAVTRNAGYTTVEYGYDGAGRKNRFCYIGPDGQPVMTAWGYAEQRKEFDEQGRLLRDSYYNEKGEPCALSSGMAAKVYGYDKIGNVNSEKYYGTDGEPVTVAGGYAEVRRAYDGSNRVKSEGYYDLEGNRVNSAAGYARIVYTYSEDGRLVRTRYLDAEGKAVEQ